jgi:hypothetical protein
VAAEVSIDPAAEPVPDATSCDVVAMGVGALMSLHAIPEAKARVALARVAARYQVPVAAVAQAVLTLVASTDEPFGDGTGRAAAQLLVQGFTNSP